MGAFFRILKDFPRYLLGGFAAAGSILLLLALWELGHGLYGDLVLPSPLAAFGEAGRMLLQPDSQAQLLITLYRAVFGVGLALAVGTVLGIAAGLFVSASVLSRPLVTFFMGIPPIAWIVLAMIWFGMGDVTVIFTVVVAAFPIAFAGALQGARTLEGQLSEMADAFKVPFFMRLKEFYLPHLFSYLLPSWIAAFGMGWKIVIMAELLAASDGAGALLGIARSQLDTQVAMAIVVLVVGSLMAVEYLILEPVRREVEAWRD